LKEKPKFYFTANAQRCKEAKSGNVEISALLRVYCLTKLNKPLKNVKGTINGTGDNQEEVEMDNEGYIERKDCIPDIYTISINDLSEPRMLSMSEVNYIYLDLSGESMSG
jgi:hypothetical protein